MGDFTLEEKVAELESASIAAAWRRPDSSIRSTPDWHEISTPSSRQVWLNGVVHAVIDDSEADERIAKTVAHYRERCSAFRWKVGPHSKPARLPELLEKHGMKLNSEILGLAGETDRISFEASPDIQIEAVTPANLDAYIEACVAGWGSSKEAGEEIRQDMARSLREAPEETLYFLARYRGRPAGSGALKPLKRSGYLLGSSSAPEFRGKGVYRALVARRLEVLRQRGIQLATIQAISDTSAPICIRMGFEPVCRFRIYHWEPTTQLKTQDET